MGKSPNAPRDVLRAITGQLDKDSLRFAVVTTEALHESFREAEEAAAKIANEASDGMAYLAIVVVVAESRTTLKTVEEHFNARS